jgi:hypothetical protein
MKKTKGPLLGPNNRRKRPELEWCKPTRADRKADRAERKQQRGRR